MARPPFASWRKAFWVVVVIQAFHETYRRAPGVAFVIWAVGVAATFAAFRFFSDAGSAWTDLKSAVLAGVILASLRLAYHALRIPVRLFRSGLKTEAWMVKAEALSRLQSEGRDLLRSLNPESDLTQIKAIREVWRNKVLDFLKEGFSEAWSAQFRHSSGYQREELIAFVEIRRQNILPHTTKLLSAEREELIEFLTEIEQVRAFSQDCYGKARAGYELLRVS